MLNKVSLLIGISIDLFIFIVSMLFLTALISILYEKWKNDKSK